MSSKKIKILHIQETIGSGGVERRRLSLAKHLDKNLFEQKFICTFERGNIPQDIRAEGWELLSVGRLKHPFQITQHKKIQKIIDDFQPDIIHGAVFEGVTMAALNGWFKKVPIVIIEETSDPQNRSWRANFLMKLFAKLSTAVVGVSPAVTVEYLTRKLKLKPSKVKLINNGVALGRKVSDEELKKARLSWGIADDDFVVGSVGRMLDDSTKRFSDIIYAYAEFSKVATQSKLVLVGDGPERVKYEKLVAGLGLQDKVLFVGYQSDMSLFYSMMNVFTLMSSHESFGLVLAEAMLHKLPVIATKVGGMKYIVLDKKTGFLIEKYNVNSLAEKLLMLYQNQALAIEMGNLGFQRAMEEFTEESYVTKVENLYLDLYNHICK